MQQHELRQAPGATHKRKRIGRGNASGHGTYSTKGMKGQKARAGGSLRPSFEGGQFPFVRKMAYKRGFTNPFRVDYEEVNLSDLATFNAGTDVTVDAMRSARLVRTNRPVKILGDGELSVALSVTADRFSKSARAKIEAAGGSVSWIGGEPVAKEDAEPKPKKGKAARVEAAAKAASAAKAAKSPKTEAEPATEAEGEA
jgi:large subunit ribosomal protein L15